MTGRSSERFQPTLPRSRGRRALLALAVVHPVPSVLNAVLVASLALVAGATPWVAAVLAGGMLGFQTSIGALNDIADVEADRPWKPTKPIPAGLVARRVAAAVVVLGAGIGLGISAAFGLAVLVVGVLGYATGVAYDLLMRARGLGWLCFAAALPLMLVWAWLAAAGTLPPAWPFLLPLAALAGPALHLANSLVDLDADASTGRRSLATWLGPHRARATLAIAMAGIIVLAWATFASVGEPTGPALAAMLVATALNVVGVALSSQEAPKAREAGWLLQAAGLAAMAVAWLMSIA